MAYDAARGQVVLFGGSDGSGYRNDTWVWDGTTWTQKSPANSPSSRRYHAMAYDAARGQVVLFGGVGFGGSRNGTWVWPSAAAMATPVVTWANPAAITFSTALSSAQLNATASVAGAFVYTPVSGTVLAVGTHTLWATFTPTDSANYTTSTKTVTIVVSSPPTVALTPSTLRFAGTNTAGTLNPITGAQTVTVTFGSAGAVAWTVSANQSWVQITNGSGTGSGTFTVGMINPGNVLGGATSASAIVTVTAAGATNSPQTVAMTLTLQPPVLNKPPIGLVDSPAQNAAGLVGAIGVTGWVVDDVGVKSVTIYRNCLAFEPTLNCVIVNGVNLAYIGDATIVTGARPDIESAYPAHPQNNRAAWGYLLLTSMLPHLPNQQMYGGQGTITLHVLAEDMEGHKRWLGRSFVTYPSETDQVPTTFTMANDSIGKPFGAIDTPKQGETVSGTFWNFGWTLTPDRNTTADADDILMPLNGTTQWVYIDGVAVGPLVAYNLCRGTVGSPVPAGLYCNDDVASIFGNVTPQATFTTRNSNPTRHRNLDAGRGPIGAYWLDTTTLTNGLHTIVWGVTDSAGRGEGIGSRYFTVLNGATDAVPAGSASSGGTAAGDSVFANRFGGAPALLPDAPAATETPTKGVGARPVAADKTQTPASTFSDVPAVRTKGSMTMRAEVAPEAALQEAPAQSRGDAGALDALTPTTGLVWGRTGFDVDTPYAEVAADEAGVRHVQIRDLGRLELWLGAVERGYLVANGTLRDLPPGSRLDPEAGVFTWVPGLGYHGMYRLAFVRGGEQISVDVTIRPVTPSASTESAVRMNVDVPGDGENLSGPITVSGWALDPQAWTGSGIDAVHVWAQRLDMAAATSQFLGAAALGGSRLGVAKEYEASFGKAGFNMTADALAAGQYDITVFVRSNSTARWEDARTVRVTVR